MTARKSKKPGYEQGVEELEAIIARLSEGKLTLEESIKAYEEGAALLSQLGAMLDEHRRRVERLDPEMGELSPLSPQVVLPRTEEKPEDEG